MFRTCVSQTPFTSEAANDMFQNIQGQDYRSDRSFLSTLRAMLFPRMKPEDRLNLYFFEDSRYTAEYVRSKGDLQFCRGIASNWWTSNENTKNYVIVHSITGSAENTEACFNALSNKFSEVCKNYQRIDKVTAFYKPHFKVLCFINPNTRVVVFYVENLDMKKLHFLQVVVPVVFPWYINKEAPLTPDEVALSKSFASSSADDYRAFLAKMAEKYDFRTARIKKYLTGYEKRIVDQQIRAEQGRISDIDRNIRDLTDRISSNLRDRDNANIRLLGLQANQHGEESELMDYFLCNKAVDIRSLSGNTITFVVKSYLDYFDRDCAERMIGRGDNYISRHAPSDEAYENMKKLLTEIFVNPEPRLRIRICAAYYLNIPDNACSYMEDYDFSESDGDLTYMPNPHIQEYGCLGNYRQEINDALIRGDYITAVEQCVSSCGSLNWADGAVMGAFVQNMYNSRNAFIELPDGSIVTVAKAIEWLKQQEEVPNEQKEEAQENE